MNGRAGRNGRGALAGIAALVVGLVAGAPGCAATVNTYGIQKPYGGIRLDAALCEKGPTPELEALAAADMPLSFVVDTASLPITIPVTVIREVSRNTR